jgi:hypothetical protein
MMETGRNECSELAHTAVVDLQVETNLAVEPNVDDSCVRIRCPLNSRRPGDDACTAAGRRRDHHTPETRIKLGNQTGSPLLAYEMLLCRYEAVDLFLSGTNLAHRRDELVRIWHSLPNWNSETTTLGATRY